MLLYDNLSVSPNLWLVACVLAVALPKGIFKPATGLKDATKKYKHANKCLTFIKDKIRQMLGDFDVFGAFC